MTAAALPDWYQDTDRGLADNLVESNRLTWLKTESRYREKHAEWIGRDAEGQVTQLTDDDMTALAERLLRDRGQPLERAADVIDYAQIIASEWVPVRDRHYSEPWPGDFDEDDPVADLAGAVAYVAEQGDMSLPFTWPRVAGLDVRQTDTSPMTNGHAAITPMSIVKEERSAPVANGAAMEVVAATEPVDESPRFLDQDVVTDLAMFLGVPGELSIVSNHNWDGQKFSTDLAGIGKAARHVRELHLARHQSIHIRDTTTIPGTAGRGTDDETSHWVRIGADLDFATPKKVGYPPDGETIWALYERSGLPPTSARKHSGHGVYPYLVFSEPVPHSEEVAQLSRDFDAVLRQTFADAGYKMDNTSDAARVRRAAGTVNLKDEDEPAQCRWLETDGPRYTYVEVRAAIPVGIGGAAKSKGSTKVAPAEVQKFLDGLPGGEPCTATKNALDKALAELRNPPESRHNSARDGAGALLRAGERRHRGTAKALDTHRDAFCAALEGERDRSPESEYDSFKFSSAAIVLSEPTPAADKGCKCLGADRVPVTPLTGGGSTWTPTAGAELDADEAEDRHQWILPDYVWELSPQLETIKQAALSRHASPDVVLHSTLAYISSSVHYRTRLETGLGPTVLNHFVIAVGGSGSGKTKSQGSARDLLDQTLTLRWAGSPPGTFIEDEIGSGEGLIEAFMGTIERTNDEGETQKFRTQVLHNAMFSADEGRTVLATAQRQGTTVLGTLCQLWSGAAAGQRNAEASRTRRLGRGNYAIGMTIGFQPETMDDLFADKAGGAPQRFACAWATHPDHTAAYVDWPGELDVTVPKHPLTMSLPADIQREVREQSAALARGDITLGQLDGHRQLMRCRMAALLAIMHKEDRVLDSHWELAGVLSDHSAALRDHLAGRAERQRAEETKRKEAATVRTQLNAHVAIGDFDRVRRAADQLIRVVTKNGGAMPRGKALNALRSDLRDVRDAAVARALTDGRLVEEQREWGNGKTGAALVLGEEPSSEG
jgi:hypothetical protein